MALRLTQSWRKWGKNQRLDLERTGQDSRVSLRELITSVDSSRDSPWRGLNACKTPLLTFQGTLTCSPFSRRKPYQLLILPLTESQELNWLLLRRWDGHCSSLPIKNLKYSPIVSPNREWYPETTMNRSENHCYHPPHQYELVWLPHFTRLLLHNGLMYTNTMLNSPKCNHKSVPGAL